MHSTKRKRGSSPLCKPNYRPLAGLPGLQLHEQSGGQGGCWLFGPPPAVPLAEGGGCFFSVAAGAGVVLVAVAVAAWGGGGGSCSCCRGGVFSAVAADGVKPFGGSG